MNFLNEHLTRQSDLIPNEVLEEQINIIGAGAIGSFTALSLVKMGFTKVKVYDFDTIDTVNMNCQFYRFKDIGKPKVEALKELIHDFTNVEIEIVNDHWKGEKLPGIVISCVDSMSVRKALFLVHHKDIKTKLFIDSRMGAETALLYTVRPLNPTDIENYEQTLYSDDDATPERCTAKSTIYTSLSLSGLIISTLKSFLVDRQINHNVMWDIKQSDMITSRKQI